MRNIIVRILTNRIDYVVAKISSQLNTNKYIILNKLVE